MIILGHAFGLFLLIVAVNSFECPRGPNCNDCNISKSDEDWEVDCYNNSETQTFRVYFKPNTHTVIKCLNDAKWTDFQLGSTPSVAKTKELYFRKCELPDNFKSIADQLKLEIVNILDFSEANISDKLTKDHLNGFPELKKLYLRSTQLTELPEDLLSRVPHLKAIFLLGNRLTTLPTRLFSGLRELETLQLGSNDLLELKRGTFDDLGELSSLNLPQNNLTVIDPHTFDNLRSLKILELNNNELVSLPRDLLINATALERLNLSRNKLTSIPDQFLTYNVNITKFCLSNQRGESLKSLPGGLFANLTRLEYVGLNKIGLESISKDIFSGSTSLKLIDLSRNPLSSLPSGVFGGLHSLTNISISGAALKTLPSNLFEDNNNLLKIDLSRNQLIAIPGSLLHGLRNLAELRLDHNKLVEFDDLTFKSLVDLQYADFSHNQLTLKSCKESDLSLYRHSTFQYSLQNLKLLNLGYNNITHTCTDWQTFINLQMLNLEHNKIEKIQLKQDLDFLSRKITVNLTFNKIKELAIEDAKKSIVDQFNSEDSNHNKREITIFIDNNPFNCDCQLYHFSRLIEKKIHKQIQAYFNIKIGNLKCFEPAWLNNTLVKDVNSSSFLCQLPPKALDYVKCPSGCSCWRRPEDETRIVDCSFKNFTVAPVMDILAWRPNHFELNLTGNLIQQFPPTNHSGYEQVTKLFLSSNNISSLSMGDFYSNLEILDLRNNSLKHLDSSLMDLLKNSTSLKELDFSSNPWHCDCTDREFFNFIQKKSINVPSLRKVSCLGMSKSIVEMTLSDFCPTTNEIILIGVSVALLGLLVGVLVGLYYKYQQEVKVWLYAHQCCLWLVTEEELDKDKLFDAFVSYSHNDRTIVHKVVERLESGPTPFKICEHERDFIPGDWIPDQISRAVESSRRTIIFLSKSFLESVWGRMEFRAAHQQSLEDGRARVIIVLLDETALSGEVDTQLRAYLRMNTYVKFDDPWFYDKLRYALPHRGPTRNWASHDGFKVFRRQKPSIKVTSDKNAIIQTGVDEEFRLTRTASPTPSTNFLETPLSP